MEITIEHDVSSTERHFYTFLIEADRKTHIGTAISRRDSSADIWGHNLKIIEKWSGSRTKDGKPFYQQATSAPDKDSEYACLLNNDEVREKLIEQFTRYV